VDWISVAYALSGWKQETKQCKGMQKSSQVQTFQPREIRHSLPDVFLPLDRHKMFILRSLTGAAVGFKAVKGRFVAKVGRVPI
jgi:hypothetical protein